MRWRLRGGVDHMSAPSTTDRLVRESEKLRDQLLRTAARADLFCRELRAETREQRERTGETKTVGGSTDAGHTPGE